MLQRVRSFVLRLTALLLVAAAGARGAARVVDGLLKHRGVPERSGAHLDQPGGCGSHAERCVVRGHQSGIRFVGGARMARSRVVRSTRPAATADRTAPSRGADATYHSRAPPSPTA